MKLDHIVHFTHTSPEASSKFWNEKGFHAISGGSHEDWGTQNALMYGPDYYIEWLTVEDEHIAQASEHPLIQQLQLDGRGFGTICLRSDNLDQLAQQIEGRGFQTVGPMDANRLTETGETVRWRLLFVDQPISSALPLPFFIEWEEPDEARFAGLKQKGAITELNEGLRLEALVFSVEDPEQKEAQWSRLLGGSLDLENCRLLFEDGKGKERLSEVHFESAGQEIVFEQGNYLAPRFV
ncbi:VOC family protein [Planococcus sp. CP5-4]|uniref:VOC family protein n=1 Tax=unclassified Planococcus (in: firmicutes) TaxID=2662419 RepID=UPI001C22D5EA|nr:MULTISPECIES: VOC family protein [unclassified Planococcus (in: firmicutes)]MBU9672364.1 VOC family protein [Planococcus sp. CP5-4_YE]MBV0909415.1 VOC family protein [Planococcus sp. CP5-4_UN]MBW6064144.1 VOC family protein [Planococcus sp. CP5-4]